MSMAAPGMAAGAGLSMVAAWQSRWWLGAGMVWICVLWIWLVAGVGCGVEHGSGVDLAA